MTKPLREAESNGVRYRWSNGSPILFDGTAWRYATPAEVLDHAAVFTALRAQPYVEQHSEVVEAIYDWYYNGRRNKVERDNIIPFAESLSALVLASATVDELVGELVKRGGIHKTAHGEGYIRIVDNSCVILPPEPSR